MGASKSMSKDKSVDVSNSRADNRRNTWISTFKIDRISQGRSGALVECLVGVLTQLVQKCFSSTLPENSGDAENSAEKWAPDGRKFFAICTNLVCNIRSG